METLNGKIDTYDNVAIDSDILEHAEAGIQVKLKAEEVGGKMFKHWQVLVGSIDEFDGDKGPGYTPDVSFVMPAGNVVLMAVYTDMVPSSTPSCAVDYRVNSGHRGEVALDLEETKKRDLEAALGDNAQDQTALGAGKVVEYLVDFTKRRPVATESNAAMEAGDYDDESFKAVWALDVKLQRRENHGRWSYASASDSTEFDVIVQIDASDLDHAGYQLWQVYDDPGDNPVAEPVAMEPDDDETLGTVGLFRFKANSNCTYVLTLARTNKVEIIDTMQGDQLFRVKRGESLADQEDYELWIPETYLDPAGIVWYYSGLSKRPNGNPPYNDSDAVTRNIKLYAIYKLDPEWIEARDKLSDLIDDGSILVQDPVLSEEDQDRLQEALEKANDILTGVGLNRPTLGELNEAYDELKAVIDSIVNPEPAFGEEKQKLQDLISEVTDYLANSSLSASDAQELRDAVNQAAAVLSTGQNAGDFLDGYDALKEVYDKIKARQNNKKNGSSDSGSGETSPSGTPFYIAGVDGTWNLINADNHSWIFQLVNGKRVTGWAKLQYPIDGRTRTCFHHFNEDGVMDYGWFKDTDAIWYYLSLLHDGGFGSMVTGWYRDPQDGRWYYLDPLSGAMSTGWIEIDHAWYYFAESAVDAERPYGSMFANEVTPDGYQVNADGVWQR